LLVGNIFRKTVDLVSNCYDIIKTQLDTAKRIILHNRPHAPTHGW